MGGKQDYGKERSGKKRGREERWRRFFDLEGAQIIYCPTCAHYLGNRRCLAYQYIPEPLWSGEVFHDAPYPGDGGYQFKER